MSKVIPVIVCGANSTIMKGVVAQLKPEYEGTCYVVHAVYSSATGARDIPMILRGKDPPRDEGKEAPAGSGNIANGAAAVFVGGVYDDAMVAVMRKASRGLSKVPWLRHDNGKPAPPLGPAYGIAIVERIKLRMAELQAEGKMGEDGVYWY